MTWGLSHIKSPLWPKPLQWQDGLIQNIFNVERQDSGKGSVQNTTKLPLTFAKTSPHHCKKYSHEERNCESKADKEGDPTTTFKLHRELSSVPLWRGESPHLHWVANILEKSHPKLSIKIYNKNFKCSIDTGGRQNYSKINQGPPTLAPLTQTPTKGGRRSLLSTHSPRHMCGKTQMEPITH